MLMDFKDNVTYTRKVIKDKGWGWKVFKGGKNGLNN